MMIIEKPNEDAAKAYIAELNKHRRIFESYWYSSPSDLTQAQREERNEAKRTIDRLQRTRPPRSLFLYPGPPTEKEAARAERANWIPERPSRTEPEGMMYIFPSSLIITPLIFLSAVHTVIGVIIILAFIGAMIYLWKRANRLYNEELNAHIPSPDVECYQIDGELTQGIRERLGTATWNRVVDLLKANDPTMTQEVTNHLRSLTAARETVAYAQDVYKIEPTHRHRKLLNTTRNEVYAYEKEACAAIATCLKNHDADAQLMRDATREAEQHSERLAHEEKLLENARKRSIVESRLLFRNHFIKM